MITKQCSTCKIYFSLASFYKDKRNKKTRTKSQCKRCHFLSSLKSRNSIKAKKYRDLYRKLHPEKIKLYQKRNKSKESTKKKRREYQKTKKYRDYFNKKRRTPKYREYAKKYREKESYKLYRLKYNKKYYKYKSETDPIYKLGNNIRSRIKRAIKGNYKSGLAIKSLGCSIDQLKIYLETQFQDGMNWENYGKWHIDHIIPLSIFDLTKVEQLSVALHYSNLQPLWAIDNLKKSNSINRGISYQHLELTNII